MMSVVVLFWCGLFFSFEEIGNDFFVRVGDFEFRLVEVGSINLCKIKVI